jgi:hypothetical protein
VEAGESKGQRDAVGGRPLAVGHGRSEGIHSSISLRDDRTTYETIFLRDVVFIRLI